MTHPYTEIVDALLLQEKSARPCPQCADGVLQISEATVSEEYAPAFHVKGRALPRRERECVAVFCNLCEFVEELKGA